ncbi:MAG TPA: hypothetical protein VNR00_15385 [Opitutus sp.]|nr:hypothetical protein [Opitutus sp.]
MKFFRFITLALAATFCAVGAVAQDAPGKKKIAITKITATDALRLRMSKQGVTLSLDSVLQALDSQVYDRVLNTRRFDVLERTDADALATEAAAAGSAFQFNQADYLLTIRVDSFNDRLETRRLASLNKTVSARTVELSAVAKITEVATQRAIASTNFQVSRRAAENRSENTVERVGEADDALLIDATREMAQKIALRAADAIFPARILAKRDKVVTINRNDQSGVKVGQVWDVFVFGDDIEDPDTGEKSKEEVFVGQVKISRVTPQNSQAQVIEDSGIERGALVRLKDDVADEEEEP